MKVLVTGGAGFIGANLVRQLVRERSSWKLTVVDLLTYAGNLENISDLIDAQKIKFVRADIADQSAMERLFAAERFDLVFHLAAESHVDRSIISAAPFIRTNVLGTEVLLSASLSAGVSRFVHISTDEVYGSLGPTGRFFETTPLDPSSPYSASKAASDLLALAFHKTHGLEVLVTRCTNNYGPYQFPEKLIPLFVTNAFEDKPLPLYGDGQNVRSWIYVDDHNRALLTIAEKGRPGEIYNIGPEADSELTNQVVTKMILELLGKPASLIQRVADRPAHDRRYAVDTAKLKKELGWRPEITFAEGIRQTVEWYRKNESWWRTVKSGAYKDYYERNYGGRSTT